MVSISEMGFHPWYRWIRGPDAYAPGVAHESLLGIKSYRTRGLNPRVRPMGRAAASPPLWSNGPRLHEGNPIGPSTLLRMVSLSNHFVPASRGGVYIKSMQLGFCRALQRGKLGSNVGSGLTEAVGEEAGGLLLRLMALSLYEDRRLPNKPTLS